MTDFFVALTIAPALKEKKPLHASRLPADLADSRFLLLIRNVFLRELPDAARRMGLVFFREMPREPGRAGNDGDAAHHLRRQSDLEQQRRDRARRVDREMAAGSAVEFGAELLQQRDGVSFAAGLARDGE